MREKIEVYCVMGILTFNSTFDINSFVFLQEIGIYFIIAVVLICSCIFLLAPIASVMLFVVI